MELAVPTDRADDPDPRGKETLSLSLSLSFYQPFVRRAPLGL
jgi:hypothetical protein